MKLSKTLTGTAMLMLIGAMSPVVDAQTFNLDPDIAKSIGAAIRKAKSSESSKAVKYTDVKSVNAATKLLAKASSANDTNYSFHHYGVLQGSDGSFRLVFERNGLKEFLTFESDGTLRVSATTYEEVTSRSEVTKLVAIAKKANKGARYSPFRGTVERGSDGSFRFQTLNSKTRQYEMLTFNEDGTLRVEEAEDNAGDGDDPSELAKDGKLRFPATTYEKDSDVKYTVVKSSSHQKKLVTLASDANNKKYSPLRGSVEMGSDGSFRFTVEDRKARTREVLTFGADGKLPVQPPTYKQLKSKSEATKLVAAANKANKGARYKADKGIVYLGSDGSFRFVTRDSKTRKEEMVTFNEDGTLRPNVEQDNADDGDDTSSKLPPFVGGPRIKKSSPSRGSFRGFSNLKKTKEALEKLKK